jgi:hypothetical protein
MWLELLPSQQLFRPQQAKPWQTHVPVALGTSEAGHTSPLVTAVKDLG